MSNLDIKYNMLYSLQLDNDYEFVYRTRSVFVEDPVNGITCVYDHCECISFLHGVLTQCMHTDCHHCVQPCPEVYVYVHNCDDSAKLHVVMLNSRGAKRMHHRLLCAYQFKKFVMRLPRNTNVQHVISLLQDVFHQVTATPRVDIPSVYEIRINGSLRHSFVFDTSTTTLSTVDLPENIVLPMRPCANNLLSTSFPRLRPAGSVRSRFFV